MPTPRSVRFDDRVISRLTSYAARRPGVTASSAAARFVDEGLRMEEHPGVIFRDGPMGRRATLLGGPDVWEVIRALRAARAAEPELSRAELLALLGANTGLPDRAVRTAIDYWAAYPDEVDALVEHTDRVEAERLRAAERATGLLAG